MDALGEELQLATEAYTLIVTYLVTYSFQIVAAIIIIAIGFILGRKGNTLVLALCEKKSLEGTHTHEE